MRTGRRCRGERVRAGRDEGGGGVLGRGQARVGVASPRGARLGGARRGELERLPGVGDRLEHRALGSAAHLAHRPTARGLACLLEKARGALRRAARRGRGRADDQVAAGAGQGHVGQPPGLGDVHRGAAWQRLGEELVGDVGALALAPRPRGLGHPDDVDGVELEPLGLVDRHDLHAVRLARRTGVTVVPDVRQACDQVREPARVESHVAAQDVPREPLERGQPREPSGALRAPGGERLRAKARAVDHGAGQVAWVAGDHLAGEVLQGRRHRRTVGQVRDLGERGRGGAARRRVLDDGLGGR